MFQLLGNDVEEPSVVPNQPPREVVKPTSGTRKDDVPPPKADPARAKKKQEAGGNEGAIKTKLDNRSAAGPSNTPSRHFKRQYDRHPRERRKETGKKDKQALQDDDERDLEARVEGTEDASAELETGDPADAAPAEPKKSLTEYFAELQVAQLQLDGRKQQRQPNQGAEDKWGPVQKIEKEQSSYVAPSTVKKSKPRNTKEKKFLDFDAKFEDETPRSAPRGGRGGSRGGFRGNSRGAPRGSSRGSSRGGRGGFNGASSRPKPAVDDKNFPSL